MNGDWTGLVIGVGLMVLSLVVLALLLWLGVKKKLKDVAERHANWNRVAQHFGFQCDRLPGGKSRIRGRLDSGELSIIANPGMPGGLGAGSGEVALIRTKGRPFYTAARVDFAPRLSLGLKIVLSDNALAERPANPPSVDDFFDISSAVPVRLGRLLAEGGELALQQFLAVGQAQYTGVIDKAALFRPAALVTAGSMGKLGDARTIEQTDGKRAWHLTIDDTSLVIVVPGVVADAELLTEVVVMSIRLAQAFQQKSGG